MDARSLPSVRGRIEQGRRLAPITWLRVGGPSEILFHPADGRDLADFLSALPDDIPVTPLGVCSNLIIRDGGLPGVAIRLGRGFADFEVLDGSRVRVGAAMLDAQVAKRAAAAGISGLEFLRTIPGAIGGAVRMNAGCYGSYTSDVVEQVTIIERSGARRVLKPEEFGFDYRSSGLPKGAIVTEAILRGVAGSQAEIEKRMDEALAMRAESQPVDQRSCGSTFRNPAGYSST
ncbi:MAG: UDP-N-acetylmuramate dehydrogenase, partial [Pseudomonadota bacterium]